MKLAVIGGSYLQEPLISKAKEMGIETHCFAWEEKATCKLFADFFYPLSITEKEKILEKCKEIGINGICTIASDTAVVTVNYIAEQMNLIGNAFINTEWTTNKYAMRKRFKECGILSPAFFEFPSLNFKKNISNLRYPLIVKPQDRSGSRGVSKVLSNDELTQVLEIAVNESFVNKAIVEEFIEGVEVSVESISWNGIHHILAITDKITSGPPHFVELEHHQPSSLPTDVISLIKKNTISVLNALEINYGASHSEFIISPCGKVYAIETGARMGGDFIGSDLVFLHSGYDYLKNVINIALGSFVDPIIGNMGFSGIFFISQENNYLTELIKRKENYSWIIRGEITSDENINLKNSSDRGGYLIYFSNKKIEQQLLKHEAKKLSFNCSI